MKNRNQNKKPKYSMWQNTGFMFRLAWKNEKSVIALCILPALLTAGKNVTELLIAPVILKKIEQEAPLSEMVAAILLFSGLIVLLAGLIAYVQENTIFGRVYLRMQKLAGEISGKIAATAYPNTMDTDFLKSKDKASRACGSNQEATEAIWNTWTEILSNVLGFIVYLLLLSSLNPLLIGVVLITSTVGYFVKKYINEWGYRHREEEKQLASRVVYIDQIPGQRCYAKDIRIFGLQDWLNDIWNSSFRLYQAFLKRKEKIYIWSNVVDLLLTLLRNGIAYAYLITLVLKEGMPASEFLLYFNTVSGFTAWVTGIIDQLHTLHRQSLDISNVREFLEWPEPFLFEEGEILSGKSLENYEICLENVSFRYPEAEEDTISHLNLTIHPGENLAVVGLNGAGKTTLVKLICGFLDPTEGRVLLNGQDIRKYNRRHYYALFAAVFQEFSVLDVTIGENVAQTVDEIDREKVWDCLEKAGLTEKVRAFPQGLDTQLGREVFEEGIELSGGELQRLMLARALYKNAPLLVLDEPTAALDPLAENDIYMKYNEMTAGRTSVFISHRLASTRFCDRILFLEKGQIKEEGTHEQLLELGGGYAELFEVQSRYYREGEGAYGKE